MNKKIFCISIHFQHYHLIPVMQIKIHTICHTMFKILFKPKDDKVVLDPFKPKDYKVVYIFIQSVVISAVTHLFWSCGRWSVGFVIFDNVALLHTISFRTALNFFIPSLLFYFVNNFILLHFNIFIFPHVLQMFYFVWMIDI